MQEILVCINNINGERAEKNKKDSQCIFKENNLDLVIAPNTKVINYLNVILNLNNGTFKPYHKLTKTITYIHIESNDLHVIIKQLLISIETLLLIISSYREVCKEDKKPNSRGKFWRSIAIFWEHVLIIYSVSLINNMKCKRVPLTTIGPFPPEIGKQKLLDVVNLNTIGKL